MQMASTSPQLTEGSPPPGWLVPGPVAMCIALCGLAAAIVFAFWDFFNVQWHYATTEPADWGHTLFIPLIALYIVALHRADLFAKPFKSGFTGIILIFLGLAFYSLTTVGPEATVLNSHNARSIGVGLTLFGICATLFGWRSLLWLWFPLLYMLVFGQRITDKVLVYVTYPLQDIAALLGYFLLDFIYNNVQLKGTSIEIVDANGIAFPLNVEEACNGMRMLMAFLALGTVIAYVGLDKWWLRIVLVLLGIPIAIVINAFRIATLGVLSLQGKDYMVGEFHSFVGLVWMIPTFGLFMLMLWFLQPLSENEDGSTSDAVGSSEHRDIQPPRFDRKIFFAMGAVFAVLLVGGYGLRTAMSALDRHLVKESVPPRTSISAIPNTIGRWEQVGEDAIFSDTVLEVLGTTRYLDRNYAIDGNPENGVLHLHIAYWTDLAGAAPHVPERCWSVHGLVQVKRPESFSLDIDTSSWRETPRIHRAAGTPYFVLDTTHPVTGRVEEVPMPVGDLIMRATQFTSKDRPNIHRIGGYFFITNGRITPSARAVENLAFDLTSSHAYYAKVEVDMTDMVFDNGTEFQHRYQVEVSEFIAELMPDLMRIMPDWRDYEGGEKTSELEP